MPDSFVFFTDIGNRYCLHSFFGSYPLELLLHGIRGFGGFGIWNAIDLNLSDWLQHRIVSKIDKGINKLSSFVKTPAQVYLIVTVLGVMLSTISWGLIVVVAVLARQLAQKVRGINYPFLIACVYFANNVWVTAYQVPFLLC